MSLFYFKKNYFIFIRDLFFLKYGFLRSVTMLQLLRWKEKVRICIYFVVFVRCDFSCFQCCYYKFGLFVLGHIPLSSFSLSPFYSVDKANNRRKRKGKLDFYRYGKSGFLCFS